MSLMAVGSRYVDGSSQGVLILPKLPTESFWCALACETMIMVFLTLLQVSKASTVL